MKKLVLSTSIVWSEKMIKFIRNLLLIFALSLNSLFALPNETLSKIFTNEMIGVDVAYLEQFTGIPRRSYDNFREYKIGECVVNVYLNGKEVRSLELENVSPQCTFDLHKWNLNNIQEKEYVHLLTVGNLKIGFDQFSADCISHCGNAADPSVYIDFLGSHADNFLEIKFGIKLIEDAAVEASHKWAEYMKSKEDEEYVIETKFNEDSKYNEIAAKFFHNVPITSIRIGYGIIIKE